METHQIRSRDEIVSLCQALATLPSRERPTWIVCDVGGVADPTVVAIGRGMPGVDEPMHRFELASTMGMEQQASTWALIRTTLFVIAFELFDKTGFGLPMWEHIRRHGGPGTTEAWS